MEFRLLKKLRRFVLVSEMKARKEITDETYSQVMLGGYYRVTKRWRMGLFGQAEQGLRWDADWGKGPSGWGWKNSQGRWDYSTVLDSTFMSQLTPKILYEVKTRLFYYHSRNALQLRVRPGVRYFVLKEGKPLWQLYTALEAYAPLNYGEGPLYEAWLYVGALYQLTSRFSFGPLIAYRQRWFRSYDRFEDISGETFDTTFTSTNIGLSAVYSW
ncbi:MAG TPA: hypothetical protein VNJ08_16800 [Bacteriovoracaceae bacterium]|nr:hypothetical protein [Bacteriovoracaceae bacterium]